MPRREHTDDVTVAEGVSDGGVASAPLEGSSRDNADATVVDMDVDDGKESEVEENVGNGNEDNDTASNGVALGASDTGGGGSEDDGAGSVDGGSGNDDGLEESEEDGEEDDVEDDDEIFVGNYEGDDNDSNGDDYTDSEWKLVKVYHGNTEIKRTDAVMCGSDECDGKPGRKACSKWQCKKNKTTVNLCLDCQKR